MVTPKLIKTVKRSNEEERKIKEKGLKKRIILFWLNWVPQPEAKAGYKSNLHLH